MGEQGNISEVVARYGPWDEHDFFVSGSTAMVKSTLRTLAELKVPAVRIKYDTFGDSVDHIHIWPGFAWGTTVAPARNGLARARPARSAARAPAQVRDGSCRESQRWCPTGRLGARHGPNARGRGHAGRQRRE